MLTLLIKDFKLIFSGEKSAAKRFANAVFSIVFIGAFVAIETFLFAKILEKIKDYANAPTIFTCLFVAVISVMMIANGVSKAQKLFFDKKDFEQLANHPVSDGMLIGSKLVFLFLNHYATAFIFIYPIIAAYGVIFSKSAFYYYFALFYPALSFFFEVGIALLMVYPVWLLFEYLKKHILIEFISAVVGLFAASLLYSAVLRTFVDMVANNNLNLIFTEESISKLGTFAKILVPINFLVDAFIVENTARLLPYVCISLGVFVLGVSLTVFMYTYIRTVTVARKSKEGELKFKEKSVLLGLAQKEITLITKTPGFIFSFTGLLVVQPFLLYLIVVAMSTIFASGTFLYYTTLFPNFVSMISVFVVIMVTLIINSGANQYITIEERTIKTMKIIPISHKKQLLIKVGIPFLMSEASLLLSVLVLLITGAIPPLGCLFAFLLATLALLVFDIISMVEELKIRHAKPRSTFLSTLYAYLLPFVYVAAGLLLSYLGTPVVVIYIAGMGIFALLGLPALLSILRNMGNWFMELETVY